MDIVCSKCGQRQDVHGPRGCEDTPERNPFWRRRDMCGYFDRKPNAHGVTWHVDTCPAAAGREDRVRAQAEAIVAELRHAIATGDHDCAPDRLERAVRGVQLACGPQAVACVVSHDDLDEAEALGMVWWSDGAGRWWSTPLGIAVMLVAEGRA